MGALNHYVIISMLTEWLIESCPDCLYLYTCMQLVHVAGQGPLPDVR